MLHTPRASALYALFSDFLTGPRAYEIPLADLAALQDLEQVHRLELLRAINHGPDISRERDADLRARLVLLGAQNVQAAA